MSGEWKKSFEGFKRFKALAVVGYGHMNQVHPLGKTRLAA